MSDSPDPIPDAEGDPDGEDEDPKAWKKFGEFGPVPVRYRHDGWTPDRQHAFITALAGCGCVDAAAKAVGMSRRSAYALRNRSDAQAFRLAWDAATDMAVASLADAAMSRAIHGVAVPIFHKGEQVGERRVHNERLTMFLLRNRDPERYGTWRDKGEVRAHPERAANAFAWRFAHMIKAAWKQFSAALDGKDMPEPDDEWVPWSLDDEK